MPTRQKVLRAIWRDKTHVEAQALELSPRTVRDRFEHIWAPADIVMAELEAVPLGALRVWRSIARGHLVLTHRESRYQPGPQPWRDAILESVCYLSLTDLHRDRMKAMLAVLNLLDHVLGSKAAEDEPWLSDGGGITAALRQVGRRFLEIQALGYGQGQLGAHTKHDYFAHTFWLCLHDQQRLNVIDPLVHRLYRNTLLRDEFWETK